MKSKLNKTAKLAFFNARQQRGDLQILSEMTQYSISHISNVSNGRRTTPQTLANAMYSLSYKRNKNSILN